MADFAPNFTFRFRTDYRSRGDRHSFTLRFGRSTTALDLTAITLDVGALLASMAVNLDNSWSVLGAAYAVADSDIFLPTPGPVSPTVGGNTTSITISARALQARYEGRGANGPRVNFSIYGYNVNIDAGAGADFRLSTSDTPTPIASLAQLALFDPPITAIDGSSASWYPYVNIKHNDHYVHKLRGA